MSNSSGDSRSSGLFGKVVTSTALVSGIILLCKLLGFLEKVLLGSIYGGRGERYQMDIYLAMVTVVVLFYDIMRYALIPSLLPSVTEELESRGEEAAWSLASTFLNVMLPVLCLAVVVVIAWPGVVVGLLFPRLPGGEADPAAKLGLAVSLLRIMFLGGAFLIVGGIAYAMLNSYKRFAAPALGDLSFKVVSILPLLFIAVVLVKRKREFVLSGGIKLVAGGVTLGCAGLLLIQLIALGRKLRLYRPSIDLRAPSARKVLATAAPLLVYAVFYFGRRIADIYFAFQMPEGTYSGLDFSYRLIEFPFRFVIEPLGYVVFPFFAALAMKENHEELAGVLTTVLRALVLLLLPMSIGLFLLRKPAVLALFAHGQFANVDLTTAPLTWYSLGIVAFGLDIILMRAYFSLRDVATPVVLEVLTFVANMALILLLRHRMQGAGIALAFTLARTGKVIILFALLRNRLGGGRLGEDIAFLAKTVGAVAIMAVAVYGCREFLAGRLQMDKKFHRLILLGAPAAVGAAVYGASVILLRIREIRDLLRMARRVKKTA